MNISARFLCQHVKQMSESEEVELTAVYSSKEGTPNYTWSKYTPSGKLIMMITNPVARGVFKPGQEYDILFSPVKLEASQA